MGEPPDNPSFYATLRSKARGVALPRQPDDGRSVLPTHLTVSQTADPTHTSSAANNTISENDFGNDSTSNHPHSPGGNHGGHNIVAPSALPPVNNEGNSEKSPSMKSESKPSLQIRMKNGVKRFAHHTKNAICHSWVNLLLVFVPIAIASHPAHLAPEIVFSMNAIAIIPLAGLLAHATEAVAARLGDTLGALLNVSFGNAVELILFIILLADDQIRVVQAALLGSILANLLLILGMAFLLGGLKYQEQIYNSTVTQMSACMLSLAVMSLLLPTAFHAAFDDNTIADTQTLRVSRGTSVVLLLVYVLYLLFQLKTHTYMYASTPQHIIDEESHPGLLAEMLNSSSSSDSSSSSSCSDSDSSSGSHTTAKKRIKRAFRRKRRKSSATSADIPSLSSPRSSETKTLPGLQAADTGGHVTTQYTSNLRRGSVLTSTPAAGDMADTEDDAYEPHVRDFEANTPAFSDDKKHHKEKSTKQKRHKKHRRDRHGSKQADASSPRTAGQTAPKVTFVDIVQPEFAPVTRRPLFVRPALPSVLSNNVFLNAAHNQPGTSASPVPNPRIAGPQILRRTASLPDRMNRTPSRHSTSERLPTTARTSDTSPSEPQESDDEQDVTMSRTAAVVMLLISTALVAVCADFLSEAIDPMVAKTGISEAFIGLIILPIVGNAAEHVTAVLVATKNKMDLAIGVAVGSSIQIAIFITPFVVILGWIMNKNMSLYFNIFETVALFVTAFVVNFLVLDGRSNYLEGSLLIAAYVIIALASFFYPDSCDASQIGGHEGNCPR